jgi:hypothetical protein
MRRLDSAGWGPGERSWPTRARRREFSCSVLRAGVVGVAEQGGTGRRREVRAGVSVGAGYGTYAIITVERRVVRGRLERTIGGCRGIGGN